MEIEYLYAPLYPFNTKWTNNILYHLDKNNLRFNELEKKLKPISKKVLSSRLKELEEMNLIKRTVYSDTPIKIEYSLTKSGKELKPIYILIEEWENIYRTHQDIEISYSNTSSLIIQIIGKKWKIQILHLLSTKTKRFGEIKKELFPISQKMLTQQLREMEKDQIIKRVIFEEKSLKVEYSLTEIGLHLLPIVNNFNNLMNCKKKDCE